MSALLVALITAITKALGQDVVLGVLQALRDAQAHADAVSLGQAQQARVDQAQATAAANANAKETADVVQAENASLLKSATDPASVREPSPDSRD